MGEQEKKVLSVKLPNDTYQRLETYREEQEISKSEAARRLLRDGLKHAGGEEKPTLTDRVLLGAGILAMSGWPAVLIYNGQTATAIGAVMLYTAISLTHPELFDAWSRATSRLPIP